jgi:hypothetical protein
MRIKICFTMLLTFGILTAVKAQPINNELLLASPAGTVAVLLASKAIREELKMTEDEINKVRDWTKDFRNKAIQMGVTSRPLYAAN